MASSTAASSCCSRLGLTKTVSRTMPPGKALCTCCRGLVMPCLVTESYLQLKCVIEKVAHTQATANSQHQPVSTKVSWPVHSD